MEDVKMRLKCLNFAKGMSGLSPRTYVVGIIMERDGFTTQIILGTRPVLDGI